MKAFIQNYWGNATTIVAVRQEIVLILELQKCTDDENVHNAKHITVAFEALDELVTLLHKYKIIEHVNAEKIRAADPHNQGFRSMHSVSKRVKASATTLSTQLGLPTKMLDDWMNEATAYLTESKLDLWSDCVVRAEKIAKTQVLINDVNVTLQTFRRGGLEEKGTWWGNTPAKALFKTVKTKAEGSCLQLQPKELSSAIDDLKKVHAEFSELSDVFYDGFLRRL